jgi:hypothetical protein
MGLNPKGPPMPPTPTHTSRTGDTPPYLDFTDLLYALRQEAPLGHWSDGEQAAEIIESLATLANTYRDRVAALTVENHHLADLLDGVMADDPAAIRDAAAWLAANRPEVDG